MVVATRDHPSKTLDGFYQDGDFVKLREASLRFALPNRWANLAKARSADFIFSGRNLGTWSKYRGIDPENKRAVVDLMRHIRHQIGKQYKVLPTAMLAAAMKPSVTRADLKARIAGVIDALQSVNANLSVTSAEQVLEEATEPLVTRNIIVVEQNRYRVRERNVLRYYARSLSHLLSPTSSMH